MTTLVVGDIVKIAARHLAYLSQRSGYHKAEFEVIAVAEDDARLNPGWVRLRQIGRSGVAGTSIWPTDQLRKVR